MARITSASIAFTVTRSEPELVLPATPTPRELKQLSDIDDQQTLRFHAPVVFFYNKNPSLDGQDPVRVVKEALGRALVHYYPLAGRLVEGFNGKLSVDCSGQGALFIEASANIRLEQLGDSVLPPYPFLDEILDNVPGSFDILGGPLLLIQVTRLLCGGFILALLFNHTMCDGKGLAQFLKAVGEIARGAEFPSIVPVWQRELLNAREPPRVTHEHLEYEEKTMITASVPNTSDSVLPPYPFLDEILDNVPGSYDILGGPLLLIQVTRLLCGGFILALLFNHTMCDGKGLAQFLKAVGEIAHGAECPSIVPVWQRELLNAREPPRVTHEHPEYEEKTMITTSVPNTSNNDEIIQRSFLISPNFIERIRKDLPEHLANCTSYELLTGCLLKCVSLAWRLDQDELVCASTVNARGKSNANIVPLGYYGNAIAFPTAVSKLKGLREKPLEYAVELVKAAKRKMSADYIRSVADFMVMTGHHLGIKASRFFIATDTRHLGLGDVDFGWGSPVYVGTLIDIPGSCFFSKYKNIEGRESVVVLITLSRSAMDAFELELEKYNLKNITASKTVSKL